MRTIIVGTRQSALALTQTSQVVDQLKYICTEHGIPFDFQLQKIVTRGDRILDVTLSKVGGKGLFVKEIEQALLEGNIDMAVHSMKDMPAELPEGLVIGAIPKRVDPRDCMISAKAGSIRELPEGAIVGTSSLRRASQLKAFRPDLRPESIRGNIDTRLRKLEEGQFDAIILAAAGLHRIGWEDRITEYLSPEICLPAVGQGALAIECRADDRDMLALLALLNHPETERVVKAERGFLNRLNGGCQVPIGAYGEISGASADGEHAAVRLTGMVGSPDGDSIIKESLTGPEPDELGVRLAEKLIGRGADRILEQARG
ncbi:hydroxymethylbilane synthase [Ferviditalea candida]|uniref:Porphobilinogen deaminase n=1 Tax=Ferviditalea candida TaxID=3108399 RepID=A0ABU5ZDV5_9BACL|nr:hydroxymethylbilane synthase [Paenibacillaceae bacterium T2]